MRKEENNKKMASDPLCTLPFGTYNESFEHLNIGEKKTLKDTKSDKNSFMPVKVVDEKVFLTKVEKHAFIVSSGRQKLPKGIESKERFLWQKLIQKGEDKKKIEDLIHYVKVTKSDRYSNNGQIICSPRSPIEIPFGNRE